MIKQSNLDILACTEIHRQTDRKHNHLCASPLTHRQTSSSTFTVRQHYCIIRRVIRIHKAWNFQSLVTFNAQYVSLCKDLSHKSAEMQTFLPFFKGKMLKKHKT